MSKGGGGGGGGGGTQTQVTQQQLPGWMNQGAMQNWGIATQVANNLMPPYAGQRVANLTPEQQNLISQLYGNVGATTPAFNQAQAVTNALQGYQAPTITPQTLAGANLQPYMNPYIQSVIDPSMTLLDQQRQQALNQIGARAAQTGAFGGSRQGVEEGVTNAQAALQAGQLGAQLYGQGFQQAQQGAQYDISQNYAAQLANAQAQQNAATFRGQMAAQGGNLATQQQQNWLQGVQAAMGGQQMTQQQQQAVLDAAMQYYAEQQQYPLQQLAIRQNALSQTPAYGGMTTYQTGPGPSTSPLMTGLGTLGTLAGIAGSLAVPGAGGVSAFGNIFSDRRLKTDIKKLGKDDETDLPIYAFRYKGDPKSYPKVVGLMAQDVEKKYPEAVADIGGHLAINYNALSMIPK